MIFARCAILTLTFVLAPSFFASAQSQVLPLAALPDAFKMIGATPQQVYARYGRPAAVESKSNGFSFGSISGRSTPLMQAYDVEGGGRIGFLFVGTYQVAGVFFDNLHATRYISLTDLLPGPIGRTRVMLECVQSDFYHTLPGDQYGWPTSNPPPAVATVVQESALTSGGMIYLRYRLENHVRKVYDPVNGTDRLLPPKDLNSLHLVQVGWFPLPGITRVADVHPAHDQDFSTGAVSWPETPCFPPSSL